MSESYHWFHQNEACDSADLDRWHQRFSTLATELNFRPQILGEAFGIPLTLWLPPAHAQGKKLLIASGFHGEEPAGPWGLLALLQRWQTTPLLACQLSLLPLVNATGFRAGTRLNAAGENPNRGFLSHYSNVAASHEGLHLLHHEDLLLKLGADGVLSCHEDAEQTHSYLYAYGSMVPNDSVTTALRRCAANAFTLIPDGEVDGCVAHNGIVANQPDSSFESWLHARGIPRTYCSETPGQADFEIRVKTNADLMQTFIDTTVAE